MSENPFKISSNKSLFNEFILNTLKTLYIFLAFIASRRSLPVTNMEQTKNNKTANGLTSGTTGVSQHFRSGSLHCWTKPLCGKKKTTTNKLY